jgi:hypothetical protein
MKIGGHRGDVTGRVIFGDDVVLRKRRTNILGKLFFKVLKMLDLFSDEIGYGAVLVEGLFRRTGYKNWFHLCSSGKIR